MSEDAIVQFDQLVHTCTGAPMGRATTVEVHHYREAWHPGVCGATVRGEASLPGGWHFHDPHGVVYPPLDTVWA